MQNKRRINVHRDKKMRQRFETSTLKIARSRLSILRVLCFVQRYKFQPIPAKRAWREGAPLISHRDISNRFFLTHCPHRTRWANERNINGVNGECSIAEEKENRATYGTSIINRVEFIQLGSSNTRFDPRSGSECFTKVRHQ